MPVGAASLRTPSHGADDDATSGGGVPPTAYGIAERLAAYALLVAGVALIVVAHWPGRLDPDSIANFDHVVSGFIGDHRSALATWLWRQAYLAIDAGPGVVLLAQTAALAAGCYLVLRSVFGRLAAAALSVAVMLAPPTFGFVALVGRDMWFVSACLLAAGIAVTVARAAPRGHLTRILQWGALAAALLLCAIAIGTRQNGAGAVPALIAALVAVCLLALARDGHEPAWIARRRALVVAGTTVVATVAFIVATTFATAAIRTHQEHPVVYTQLWDLGYLTQARGERFIPPLPRAMQPVQTVTEVRERWRPTTSLYMRWSEDLAHGAEPLDDDAVAALDEAWRHAIREHPLTYLRGRFSLWVRQLGIGHTPGYTLVARTADNRHGLGEPRFPALSDAALDVAYFWSGGRGSLKGGVIHHAWVYLLICIAGVTLLLPRFPPPVRVVGALGAFGVGLQAGLFVTAPSVQWRYELPTVYAALLVACVGIALLVRTRRARARA